MSRNKKQSNLESLLVFVAVIALPLGVWKAYIDANRSSNYAPTQIVAPKPEDKLQNYKIPVIYKRN